MKIIKGPLNFVSQIYRHTVKELVVGHDLLFHPITFDPRYTGTPCISNRKLKYMYPLCAPLICIHNIHWTTIKTDSKFEF
jgi:hypothetical protein